MRLRLITFNKYSMKRYLRGKRLVLYKTITDIFSSKKIELLQKSYNMHYTFKHIQMTQHIFPKVFFLMRNLSVH